MPGPAKQFPSLLQLRVTREWLERLDRVRGDTSRSEWIREAIEQCVKRAMRRRKSN